MRRLLRLWLFLCMHWDVPWHQAPSCSRGWWLRDHTKESDSNFVRVATFVPPMACWLFVLFLLLLRVCTDVGKVRRVKGQVPGDWVPVRDQGGPYPADHWALSGPYMTTSAEFIDQYTYIKIYLHKRNSENWRCNTWTRPPSSQSAWVSPSTSMATAVSCRGRCVIYLCDTHWSSIWLMHVWNNSFLWLTWHTSFICVTWLVFFLGGWGAMKIFPLFQEGWICVRVCVVPKKCDLWGSVFDSVLHLRYDAELSIGAVRFFSFWLFLILLWMV